MLSKELEYCLNAAFKEARDQRHEFITVEHLLLALLDIPQVNEVLRACGTAVENLRRELADYVQESTPRVDSEDPDVQPPMNPEQEIGRASCRERV